MRRRIIQRFAETAHLVLAIAWALAIPSAFLFGWWESVAFVVFASIYANVATHLGAFEAARAKREIQKQSQ